MNISQIRQFILRQDELEREVKKTHMFGWVDPRETMKEVASPDCTNYYSRLQYEEK